MSSSSRLTLSAILAGGTFALACGGDSGGPVTPQRLVVAAGDTQSALTEATLPLPLRVRLTGSDGRAFAGATVTWTVTAGTATLGTGSSVTDDTGSASTTVRLGVAAGQIAVRAAVPGVQAITFTATACDYPPVTLGAPPTSGTLATTDCRFAGFYTDFYSIDLTSGQHEVSISDSSEAFDSYVELYTFSGDFVGLNDDIEPTVITHSRLDAIVAPGNYLVAPSSWNPFVTGPYRVSVVSRVLGLVNCELVWVTRGVVVTDSVTANDCGNAVSGYYDIVGIYAEGGSVLRIKQRSAVLNATLRLLNSDGLQVAFNDDSATGYPDAFLTYTVPQGDGHYVLLGTAAAGQTGAYTLEISASTTLSGTAPSVAPARFAPLRAPKGLPRRAWAR